ncbi:MAG: hypothetical protein II336_18135 [Loktanella sp.]|nr:hypothetical protein [Loktanella sp.]
MLADYVSAGLPPDLFWRITLREYAAHMDGAARRLEREHKSRAWLAHTTAALSGVSGKKFPKLEELTAGKPKAEPGADLLLIARRWNAAVNMQGPNRR